MLRNNANALSLALLAHGASHAAAACDGVVSTFTGACTFANFEANLEPGCDLAELFPQGDDPADAIAKACAYDTLTAFVEIQGTYQRDRRYFSGGGPLVDGGSWEQDAARLERFETNLGAGTVIAFPEYAARVQYNKDQSLGENGYPANMNLDTGCKLSTIMCCFTDDSQGEGFAKHGDATTDVCHHDLSHSPQSNHIKKGWSVFPGNETSTHCVGFTWKEGEDELLGNMMYDVSLRNSANKGYVKGVPGAPMCGCIEHMPVVETAACRTASKTDAEITYSFTYQPATDEYEGYVYASNTVGIAYADCDIPDLKKQFVANQGANTEKAAMIDAHLVGDGGCANEVGDYLNNHFFAEGKSLRYQDADPTLWSDIIAGKGAFFLPPDHGFEVAGSDADAEFRGLIDNKCKDYDGNPRHCIVRRKCASCYDSHVDIYYQRLTPLPTADLNFLKVFLTHWRKEQNDMAAGDFALYSTYQDAREGTNAWTWCNYNDGGIGFPRDCGPTGQVGWQWNSYTRGGGYAGHHAFYVEKPSSN